MPSILPLLPEDINSLSALQPPGWNDIRVVIRQHIDTAYFHGVKLVEEDQIIGIGQLIDLPTSAWIGNIIVHPDHRLKGLGKLITQQLIDMAHGKTCLLLATKAGVPLYDKLGFQETLQYVFLEQMAPLSSTVHFPELIPAETHHLPAIFQLDQLATGEDRSAVLSRFLQDSFVIQSKESKTISGFYLPHLGDGLIISDHYPTGIALLRFRASQGKNKVALPASNTAIIGFLIENGYRAYRRAYKMSNQPFEEQGNLKMIFSRIGGYLG